jgi:hypothetical protein
MTALDVEVLPDDAFIRLAHLHEVLQSRGLWGMTFSKFKRYDIEDRHFGLQVNLRTQILVPSMILRQ